MTFKSKVKDHITPELLITYLSRRFTYHNDEEWEGHIDRGRIRINGVPAVRDSCICSGDVIEYEPEDWDEPPADLNYRIIYEDESLLIIDKPGNLMVHASGRVIRNTLIFQLRYEDPHTSALGEGLKLCNRLDKETSGLVIVAKDSKTLTHLHRQFFDRKVEKEYAAIVFGSFKETSFTVDLPLGPHLKSYLKGKYGHNPEHGKYAVTGVSVEASAPGYSMLSIKPKTGRTNQIRAHLEAIGHPIVGDKLYSGDDSAFVEWTGHGMTARLLERLKMGRQALHARRLSFLHPLDNKTLTVESPVPVDMREFWEKQVNA